MANKSKLRDPELTRIVTQKIRDLALKKQTMKICHICGTHEWTITKYGLRDLIPPNVEVISGPGCPVCIVPASEIDEAVELSLKGIVITCFGDVLRIPGSNESLLDAKAKGADVRVVYSVSDAVRLSKLEKEKEFVFFSVGFETTAPSTALEVRSNPPKNLSFLLSNRLIPPAMKLLVEMKELNLNGFIAPGHVSTIIGLKPYKLFPERYHMPTVVAGFEPLDVLFAIYMILKQIAKGKARLENEYTRVVHPEGNTRAQKVMHEIFEIKNGNWRGLGEVKNSALEFRKVFSNFDARKKYNVRIKKGIDIQPGCKCHFVIVGKIKPTECPLFIKVCTPWSPVGACMVGLEGTCNIWARNVQT